jgi:hypothetical protein
LFRAIAMLRVRPAFRFRLRTLMLLVLLAGVALGTERAWRRRQEYLNRAAYHAAEEAKLSADARALAAAFARYSFVLRIPGCGNPRQDAEALKIGMTDCAKRAAEHRRSKEWYLRAASRPWGPGPGPGPGAQAAPAAQPGARPGARLGTPVAL